MDDMFNNSSEEDAILEEGHKALGVIKEVTAFGLGIGVVTGKTLFNLGKKIVKSGLEAAGDSLKSAGENINTGTPSEDIFNSQPVGNPFGDMSNPTGDIFNPTGDIDDEFEDPNDFEDFDDSEI